MSLRHPVRRWLASGSAILISSCAAAAPGRAWPAQGLAFTPLDDMEDATPWLTGDPNTDLEQKDAAVTSSTEFVREGERSLAFKIRVNWTKRPTETYAKGWPMLRRTFESPRDWSCYDYVCFWLYPRTAAPLLQERVLRIGFPSEDRASRLDWYTIPNIKANQWQQVMVPVLQDVNWQRVQGISFYVAEAWYDDGDAVDFFIDDLRLAQRTQPAFASCAVSARPLPRGQGLRVEVKVEGPLAGASVWCRVEGGDEGSGFVFDGMLAEKETVLTFSTPGLRPGGHVADVTLRNAEGVAVDTCRQHFRSLQSGKRSYLKLITFYTKPLLSCEADVLRVLNSSAYAGVAIPMAGSYDTDPVPDIEQLMPQARMVRETLTIDPWPWVALNRMISAPADGSGHAPKHAQNVAYFHAIKGLDLGNETGARADLMKRWRNAVRIARDWRSPGVMIDFEAYNNYRAYHVPSVARERGESIDEVIRKCEALGADLARVIAEEYPKCIVWSLFSRLEKQFSIPARAEPLYTTPSHITLGLLEYAQQHDVPLRFLCGGETTPGYCNKDVAALKQKILRRDRDVASVLEQFSERFFLAGTISPFHDYRIVTSFIEKGYADSPIRSLSDFQPMFQALFEAYDWVWVYASSAAKTLPYNPDNSRSYGVVLGAALDASAGAD